MERALFNIFIFPGFFFLIFISFMAEYLDRKLHARFQNRIGPPWFQPFADFIKLVGKEDFTPLEGDSVVYHAAPAVSLTAVITAFFYIPLWNSRAVYSFNGDLVVVLYLLTLPTLGFFLGGWYSRSLFSMIGAVRTLTQLFAYEIPLLLSILAPAILAGSWSLSEISAFYSAHPWFWLANIVGFCVSVVTLLGKLEKVPFDIPEAETEIVSGCFTEYSGRLLAVLRLALNVELVVGASLIAAVFLPWGLGLPPAAGFAVYLLKVMFVITLIAFLRTLFARVRIDQMIKFCWQYVAPIALVQVIITLIVKGVFFS